MAKIFYPCLVPVLLLMVTELSGWTSGSHHGAINYSHFLCRIKFLFWVWVTFTPHVLASKTQITLKSSLNFVHLGPTSVKIVTMIKYKSKKF